MNSKSWLAPRWSVLALLIVLAVALLACKKFKQAQQKAEQAKKAAAAVQGPPILTGSKTGNYYKAAQELNGVLPGGKKLTVKETKGSFDNLAQLGQGKAKYAIVQFDTLIMFLKMGGRHKTWANNSLGVAPLSNEMVHIIVSKKAKIKTISDLKNKRIAAGSETSGSFVSAFTVMSYFNDVNLQKYRNTFNESYDKSIEKLRSGKLDALVITSSPGMPLLKNLPEAAGDDIEVLDLGEKLEMPKGISYVYTLEKLPANTYPWQKKEAHMLATPAYLFAYAKFSSAEVKALAEALYGKGDELRKGSNLWELATVDGAKRGMKDGVGFHAGARIYLQSQK